MTNLSLCVKVSNCVRTCVSNRLKFPEMTAENNNYRRIIAVFSSFVFLPAKAFERAARIHLWTAIKVPRRAVVIIAGPFDRLTFDVEKTIADVRSIEQIAQICGQLFVQRQRVRVLRGFRIDAGDVLRRSSSRSTSIRLSWSRFRSTQNEITRLIRRTTLLRRRHVFALTRVAVRWIGRT